MLMILEGHRVNKNDDIISGTNSDRVILYHPYTVEELLKDTHFTIESIDLLSCKTVFIDLFQLEQFVKVGIQI
jgi:hypothetical protein